MFVRHHFNMSFLTKYTAASFPVSSNSLTKSNITVPTLKFQSDHPVTSTAVNSLFPLRPDDVFELKRELQVAMSLVEIFSMGNFSL